MQDWEPLSIQQKQAASAVEVFRIIEEVCIIAEYILSYDSIQEILNFVYYQE